MQDEGIRDIEPDDIAAIVETTRTESDALRIDCAETGAWRKDEDDPAAGGTQDVSARVDVLCVRELSRHRNEDQVRRGCNRGSGQTGEQKEHGCEQ
jgi:hypothetical protein